MMPGPFEEVPKRMPLPQTLGKGLSSTLSLKYYRVKRLGLKISPATLPNDVSSCSTKALIPSNPNGLNPKKPKP